MMINGKQVVDAVKPLHVSISDEDARLGKTKDPGKCAAARAIIRTIADAKSARVHVGRTYIEYPTKWVRYKTPVALKLEIVSFDRNKVAKHAVGNYTLYAPPPADRLDARKNKPAGKTAGKRKRPHIARIYRQIEGVRARGANR